MWRTLIKISYCQLLCCVSFYIMLIIFTLVQFANTKLDTFSFVFVVLLMIDGWHCWHSLLKIKGEFALFHNIDQLYWCRQRWHITARPMLFRYVVIVNLTSCRRATKRTLLLASESFTNEDWRTLHYFLRHLSDLKKDQLVINQDI